MIQGLQHILVGASVALLVVWLAPRLSAIFSRQEGVLRQAFEQHHRYLKPQALRLVLLIAFCLLVIVLYLLLQTWLVIPVAAVLAWVVIPVFLRGLNIRKKKHLQRAIPEFCDLISASLQSGSSLRTAISRAEQAIEGPLRVELHQVLRDIRLGHTTDQAFALWAQRSQMSVVHDLAFCVRLSAQTGGNLAEALMRLGESFRQQIALQAKAAALTAQGRLQALIMLAMPPLLFLATSALDPFVSEFFLQTPLGLGLVAVMSALELVGALWVRRIVRFEV